MNRLLFAALLALTAAAVQADPVFADDPSLSTGEAPAAVAYTHPDATPARKAPSALIVEEAKDGKAAILITNHPKVLESVKGYQSKLLRYRLNENLPEITHEALLTGKGSKEDLARLNDGRDKVGTLPKLKLIPCDDGCVGNADYETAAKQFIAAYEQGFRNGTFVPRGVMTVKVRYFKQRGALARHFLPGAGNPDIFAISFPLEGKLITLASKDFSSTPNMKDLTLRAAGQLWTILSLEVGVGKRPGFFDEIDADNTLLKPIVAVSDAVHNVFGKVYSSSISPMTEADNNLLPAIDGIEPNEIDPLDREVRLYWR